MLCRILKPFDFSRDGINTIAAYEDTEADIPAFLAPGLIREGFVEAVEAKAMAAAPENKMLTGVEENKVEDTSADMTEDNGDDLLAQARAAYQEHFGKRPYHGWSANDIHAKIDGEVE